MIHITADHYFRRPVSETFHGRDVFAPIAAWLSKGIDSARLGDVIEDYVRLPVPVDRIVGDSLIKGEICAVDRFGNCITNIRAATLEELAQRTNRQRFKVLVAAQEIPVVSGGYGQEAPLFALVGSSGLAGDRRRAASSAAQISGRDGARQRSRRHGGVTRCTAAGGVMGNGAIGNP